MLIERLPKASSEVSAPVADLPRFGGPERLTFRDLVLWRLQQALGGAIVVALVAVLGAALWLMWQPFDPSLHRQYSKSDLEIAALARVAAGNGTEITNPDVTPGVEPVSLIAVPEDLARRANAMVPFSSAPNFAARPFIFVGTPQEHEYALTCLALAGYYEAGDDPAGQSAVVQVVLNRVRHPAFPKAICGVVLQGAARSTGCQFTFACDGSMARRAPSPEILARARSSAERALQGAVFTPVGEATHYHADWVIPRWSTQMDKITAFHGHLFFRWRGIWGLPGAFRGVRAGPELLDSRFMHFVVPTPMTVDRNGETALPQALSQPLINANPTVSVAGMGTIEATGGVVRSDDARHIYYVYFGGDDYPGSYAVTAWKICAGKSPCWVYGWRSAAAIPAFVSISRPNMVSFAFAKHDGGVQESLWNCREIPRENKAQCLAGTAVTGVAPH